MSHVPASAAPSARTPSNSHALMHNIRQLIIPQLKDLCRSLGLSAAAKRKADLYERVLHFIEANSIADRQAEMLALELLVMKLLNNDPIPSFMNLVQSMRVGAVNQQAVSDSMQQYRQASGISRPLAPRALPSDSSHLRHASGSAHVPPEDAYNGPMLFFRSTLLYNLRAALGQAQVLRASKGRFAKQFIIRLSHSELQLLNSKKNMRIYIFSGVESTPDPLQAMIQFPPIEIYVDGVLTKQFVKGIKGKAGTSRPADLTPYITKDQKPSHIRIVYSDAAEKYILYPYIVEEFEPSDAVEVIEARPHISALHTKDKIKRESEAADDDIQVATLNLSLRCPITYARMKHPFTSVTCDHVQCFDGLSFLTMQQRIPSWQCPVCSKTIREDSICVSDYIKEILDSTSEEVDTVKLEADGSWTIASEEDLKGDDAKQESEGLAPAADTKADESVEIISLDSDSDDESGIPSTTNPENEIPVPSVAEQLDATVGDVQDAPQEDTSAHIEAIAPEREVSDRTPTQSHTESRALPQSKSPLNIVSSGVAESNQDSDEDRVLATYRKQKRPRIKDVPSVNPVLALRTETSDSPYTSDLTQFAESEDFIETDEAALASTLQVEQSRREANESHNQNVAESLKLSNPPTKSAESSAPAGDSTPCVAWSESPDRENSMLPEATDISESQRDEAIQKPANGTPNETETHSVARTQTFPTENPEIERGTEGQQGEVRVIKNTKPVLSGSSIISAIHGQISRAASPLVQGPTTTGNSSHLVPRFSRPGLTDNQKTQNSSKSQASANMARNDSSAHSWLNFSSKTDRRANIPPRHPQGSFEDVYLHPDGGSSSSTRSDALTNNSNPPAYFNTVYGGAPVQQVNYQRPNLVPYHLRNVNFVPLNTSQREGDRGIVHSNTESNMNRGFPNYHAREHIQEGPQMGWPNEQVNSSRAQPGGTEITSHPDDRHPHTFSRSPSIQQYDAPPTRQAVPYSQLIAMSSNMINAYKSALSTSAKNPPRPHPEARSASNITRNTAFEPLQQRQSKNPTQSGPASPVVIPDQRPVAHQKLPSEPAISTQKKLQDTRVPNVMPLPERPTMDSARSSNPGETQKTSASHSQANKNATQLPSAASLEAAVNKSSPMLKGILGIDIASNALMSEEPHSDFESANNSFLQDDTAHNSTGISLDGHIQDMMLQTPASRKRTIDEDPSSSKRSSRHEKFNIRDINSSDIIELESD